HIGEQWLNNGSLRPSYLRLRPVTVFRNSRLQPFLDQAKYPGIGHAMRDELHDPLAAHVVEEATNVRIKHPVHSLPLDARRQRVQRLMRAATGPEPVRKAFEVDLIDLIEDRHHSLLNNFVLQCSDAQRTLSPHRPSEYRLVVRVVPDTLHGAPDCADRQVDPPIRFHTPATSRHRFREKLDAEGRRSYRGVVRRSDGGAER